MIRELGRPGDLGWVVLAHGEMYAEEYGFDERFEGLVARIVADCAAGHDAERENAWIAEVDGERAGCVFCVDGGDGTAVVVPSGQEDFSSSPSSWSSGIWTHAATNGALARPVACRTALVSATPAAARAFPLAF